MPEVFLSAKEIEGKSLPPVCIVCGRKATLQRVMLVQEVNPLLSMLTKVSKYRMCNAWLPLCDRHQRYFGGFSWFGIAVLVLLVSLIGTIAVGAGVFGIRHVLFFLGSFCVFITIAACASFGHLFYRRSRVRPSEIDKKGVRLTNVCTEFVDAVEADDQD